MYIEIHGVQFENKGASLMLSAAISEIRSRIPSVRIVLAPGRRRPYLCRARLGGYQKLWFSAWGYQVGDKAGAFIPKRIRNLYGLVRHSELDVVLDASGFAYGDQWDPSRADDMARAGRKLKRNGGKLILMPQAMGPFTRPRARRSFKKVLDLADLVFPRDEISYQYVSEMVGESDRVLRSPDFTVLAAGKESERSFELSGRFAIIPNKKMLEVDGHLQGDRYKYFIVQCIEILRALGESPYFLVHEGEADVRLAGEINELIGQKLDIVTAEDPLEVKGIIGAAKGVISSRYHGLVNALSQGIPALATSWSHKYSTLMKDYGCADALLDVSSDKHEIESAIEFLISDESRDRLIETLLEAADRQRAEAAEMWRRVFEVAQGSSAGQPETRAG